ncbi:MAG: DnaB-like helicase C-terminal domain-containing protein, partial [Campylobacterota bacterium]
RTLVKKGMPIDEEFIKKELLNKRAFDEQVMLEILSANPAANLKAYVNEIKEKSKLRKLLHLTNDIKKTAIEDNGSSDAIVALVEQHLLDLDNSSNIDMPIDMDIAINDFKNMTPPPLIKIGIPAIDIMLMGGIESAQLVHIGGDSNVGKTILTKQILKNVSNYHRVLFFSFEMPKWKIARQLQHQQFNRQNYFITDSQMMGNDVSDVARMTKRMKRKQNIRFVVIDSKMKLTHAHFKGNSSVERIADIDAILARLCQELDIVIFMITQLSKEDQKNGTMSGYGSGMSDYEADMKLLLSFFDGKNDTRRKLQVMKNRQDVNYEPVTLQLDTKSLEFTSTVVETIYDSHLPFGGTKINVTHRPKLMPDKPVPIEAPETIEAGLFL